MGPIEPVTVVKVMALVKEELYGWVGTQDKVEDSPDQF